jgi:hypothetical protein
MSVNVINVTTAGSVIFENDVFTGGITPIAYGGTNASSFTSSANGIVVYNGTSLINHVGPQVTSDGYLKNNKQPAFFAQSNVNFSNISGDGSAYTLAFNSTLFNHSSSFNTTTHTFTAPIAGTYSFYVVCDRINKGTSTSEVLYIECTRPTLGDINFHSNSDMTNTSFSLQLSCLVTLDTADTVKAVYYAFGGAKDINLINSTISPSTYFQGNYLG